MSAFSNGAQADQVNTLSTRTSHEKRPNGSAEVSVQIPRVLVICSSCKSTLSVKRIYLGNPIQCKQCGELFWVPADVDAGAMPVVARSYAPTSSRLSQTDDDNVKQEAGTTDTAILQQISQLLATGNELRTANEKLDAANQELTAERDALAAQLESAERLIAVGNELRTANETLHAANQKLTAKCNALVARLESAEILCKQLAIRSEELQSAQARREAEFDAILSTERAQRQELFEQVQALRENAEETARVAEQLIWTDGRPGEMTPGAPLQELAAIKAQAEELKYRLDEANGLYRAMAETLVGLGIPI